MSAEVVCCSCTKAAVTYVVDGAYRKPVCEQHERMYREQGYRTTEAAR